MHAPSLGRRGNLLVVEDDPDLREGLADLLRSEGYDVACASNGAEALTSLRSGQAADLIVLDLMMPTMDGWEFRMHQKRDPALASIPVMAITADDSPKAGAIDATFVLRKPFQLDELLKSLHAVMKAVQAERLAQTERLASVGRLAAGLAHEINNPLAYVLSNLRILSTQWIPKLKQAEGALGGLISADELSDFEALVRESLDGGIRIEGIVRDIQVHTSAREDAAEVIDLRHALDSALKIAATRIRPRARVVRDYKDLPPVLAHPIRIGQVLLNILVNAADAVPEGSPEVQTIRVSTFEQNGRCVVEIADSGSGMPSSVLPRIFDPFFTTKPVGSGTGLGLFICQGIVLSLGGEITVESQVGKGTVFRVSLPVHLGVKTPSPPPVDAVRQPAAIQARARILVVDDDVLVARGIARVLSQEHDVTTVSSGQEAVDRISADADAYDLVLCDLHMPIVTGMDVWEEVRRRAPGMEQKLIFMSGGVFTQRALEFTRTVENTVLDKPIDNRALKTLVVDRMKLS